MLLDFLPRELEKDIFNLIDPSINNFEEYEKKHWKIRFTNSLYYLDKKKLTCYIRSHLNDTYNVSHKYRFGKHLGLASYGLEIDDEGSFVKGDGRYLKYNEQGIEKKGITFLSKEGVITGLRFNNLKNYNFKQKRTMWLLKKFFELD